MSSKYWCGYTYWATFKNNEELLQKQWNDPYWRGACAEHNQVYSLQKKNCIQNRHKYKYIKTVLKYKVKFWCTSSTCVDFECRFCTLSTWAPLRPPMRNVFIITFISIIIITVNISHTHRRRRTLTETPTSRRNLLPFIQVRDPSSVRHRQMFAALSSATCGVWDRLSWTRLRFVASTQPLRATCETSLPTFRQRFLFFILFFIFFVKKLLVANFIRHVIRNASSGQLEVLLRGVLVSIATSLQSNDPWSEMRKSIILARDCKTLNLITITLRFTQYFLWHLIFLPAVYCIDLQFLRNFLICPTTFNNLIFYCLL